MSGVTKEELPYGSILNCLNVIAASSITINNNLERIANNLDKICWEG